MLCFCLCYVFIAVPIGVLGSNRKPIECGKLEFSCNNGQCIDKNFWCDNVRDCRDGSDEQDCKQNESNSETKPCPANFFRCNNGLCIPMKARCDGFDSCGDSSDEHNCFRGINDFKRSKNDKHLSTFNVSRPSQVFSVNSTNVFQDVQDEEDEIRQDYFDVSQFMEYKERARKWLLSQRKEDYGWGDDTARAIVALSLSKEDLYRNTDDERLMIKQLHLKLSIALARNPDKMDLGDLALYINALQASCSEARNFYGFDLVSKLRDRVDMEHSGGRYVMPLIYVTLCLNNADSRHDVAVLQNLFLQRETMEDKNDIQALVLLATVCMNKSNLLIPLLSKLVSKISKEMAGNIYEVALIVQALTAAEVQDTWNRDEAMKFILSRQDNIGSFGDILATYYVLPVLSGKSLLSLKDHCNKSHSDGLESTEGLVNSKNIIHISYGIYFGNPKEQAQIMFLSVSESATFFDVMRLAQERNLNYRFDLDEKKGVSSVYSIGGVPNDAERGIYWMLYFEKNNGDVYRISDDIKKLILTEGTRAVFWRRPINESSGDE